MEVRTQLKNKGSIMKRNSPLRHGKGTAKLIQRLQWMSCYALALFCAAPAQARTNDAIPDQILTVFENKCAFSGCHAGPGAGNGLDLTAELAYASLVGQPSSDFPQVPLVKPGEPLKSYLLMKLVGSSGIKGEVMPKGDKRLSKAELRLVAAWIKSIPKTARVEDRKQRFADPFVGLSLATLQTAQTVRKGAFSYRIAHRWLGTVDAGFDQFFGLDAGAHILTEFSFAFSDNLTVTLGRSGVNSTFEFNAKYQLLRQRDNNSTPISVALFGGLDWLTLKQISDPQNAGQFLNRTSSERFPIFIQLVSTRKLSDRIALLLSPGFLLNGNVTQTGESAIFALGFGGKVRLSKGLSVFVEGSSILSGLDDALPVGGPGTQNGQPIVYDAFTLGLEHTNGGHVFHLYITNSLGLTPTQVMNGGNLDFARGKFRLGFNIYRVLRFF